MDKRKERKKMRRLYQLADETITKYPQLTQEVKGIVELCQDEIEAGESTEHEIELAMTDIDQTVEEHKKKTNEQKNKITHDTE